MLRLFPESFFSYPSHRSFNSFSLLFYIFHAPPSLTSGGRPPLSVPDAAGFGKAIRPFLCRTPQDSGKVFLRFTHRAPQDLGKIFRRPYHTTSLPRNHYRQDHFPSCYPSCSPALLAFSVVSFPLILPFRLSCPAFLFAFSVCRPYICLSQLCRGFHTAAFTSRPCRGFHTAAFTSRPCRIFHTAAFISPLFSAAPLS